MWDGSLSVCFLMQYTQTLTLVTQRYNQLHSTMLDVELGLVKEEMDTMRRQLEPALQELVWSQEDLTDYIQSTRDLMKASLPQRTHKNRITAANGSFFGGPLGHFQSSPEEQSQRGNHSRPHGEVQPASLHHQKERRLCFPDFI